MSTLTIPKSMTNGTPANADDVNENFTAVANIINGNLDDDNIDTIVEATVVFNGSGHDHSGGANGSTIDGDSVAMASGTTEGTIKIDSGSLEVINATVSDTISFTTTFSEIPVIFLTLDDGGADGRETSGINGTSFIQNVTSTGFKIANNRATTTFYWQAVGI